MGQLKHWVWNRITTTGFITILVMELMGYLVLRYTSFPVLGWMAELVMAGLAVVAWAVSALLYSLVLIPAAAVTRWLHLRGLAAFFWAGFFTITIGTLLLEGWGWVPFSVSSLILQLLVTVLAASVFGGLMALVARLRGYHKPPTRMMLR